MQQSILQPDDKWSELVRSFLGVTRVSEDVHTLVCVNFLWLVKTILLLRNQTRAGTHKRMHIVWHWVVCLFSKRWLSFSFIRRTVGWSGVRGWWVKVDCLLTTFSTYLTHLFPLLFTQVLLRVGNCVCVVYGLFSSQSTTEWFIIYAQKRFTFHHFPARAKDFSSNAVLLQSLCCLPRFS